MFGDPELVGCHAASKAWSVDGPDAGAALVDSLLRRLVRCAWLADGSEDLAWRCCVVYRRADRGLWVPFLEVVDIVEAGSARADSRRRSGGASMPSS